MESSSAMESPGATNCASTVSVKISLLTFKAALEATVKTTTQQLQQCFAERDDLRRERSALLESLDVANDEKAALKALVAGLERQVVSAEADGANRERVGKDEAQRLKVDNETQAQLISKQKETIAELRAAVDEARTTKGLGFSASGAGGSPSLGDGLGGIGGKPGDPHDGLFSVFTSDASASSAAAGEVPSATGAGGAAHPQAIGPDLRRLILLTKGKIDALTAAKDAADVQLGLLAAELKALSSETTSGRAAAEAIMKQVDALLRVNEGQLERIGKLEGEVARLQKAELELQAHLRTEHAGHTQARASLEAKLATVASLTAQLAAAEEAVTKRGDLLCRANESLALQETSLHTLRAELLRLRELVDKHADATKALKVAHADVLGQKESEMRAHMANAASAREAGAAATAAIGMLEARMGELQSSLAEAQLQRAQYHTQLAALEAVASACWCKGKPAPDVHAVASSPMQKLPGPSPFANAPVTPGGPLFSSSDADVTSDRTAPLTVSTTSTTTSSSSNESFSSYGGGQSLMDTDISVIGKVSSPASSEAASLNAPRVVAVETPSSVGGAGAVDSRANADSQDELDRVDAADGEVTATAAVDDDGEPEVEDAVARAMGQALMQLARLGETATSAAPASSDRASCMSPSSSSESVERDESGSRLGGAARAAASSGDSDSQAPAQDESDVGSHGDAAAAALTPPPSPGPGRVAGAKRKRVSKGAE